MIFHIYIKFGKSAIQTNIHFKFAHWAGKIAFTVRLITYTFSNYVAWIEIFASAFRTFSLFHFALLHAYRRIKPEKQLFSIIKKIHRDYSNYYIYPEMKTYKEIKIDSHQIGE
ncbi:conserved protein [Methanosarcina mazei Go1]|uniref:Conserved protein n=1 Tax=Methanosarcina mazei (strain ATCC BAA-159 / DSM 3647 / Goe1 / Go1 / JCM 11833 / OCM 88) TaxID=192952 RepID=Q8PSV7_METMA|nr:conserved protein [Methanosarcina mazei Go1]